MLLVIKSIIIIFKYLKNWIRLCRDSSPDLKFRTQPSNLKLLL